MEWKESMIGMEWNGCEVKERKGSEGKGMEMKEGTEEKDESGKQSMEGDEMII
jgi:hypothetical protein